MKNVIAGASRQAASTVMLLGLVLACSKSDDKASPPPVGAPAREVALAGSSVFIGAGDIARCESRGDEQTAAIVDSVLRVDSAANVPTAVFTIGDNAYSVGSTTEFKNCFTASWGSPRIMRVIRPSPGNHEYNTPGAVPYYNYFGARAGPAGRGYYSFDFGDWHIVSLNSELAVQRGSEVARAQEDWLKADLAAHRKLCTVAYFHRPLFSSGYHGNTTSMRHLWEIMYANNVDLVLGGHDHHYERFLPMTPAGIVDTVRGMVSIVVGTGGGNLRGVSNPPARNSAITIKGYFGLLKLNLGPSEYRHAFLDSSGRVWDEGGRKCH